MISPTKTAPTIVTNALPGESQAFTIKATGKAFRILIDGLYQRKEAAVVREIMSNAWDSHAAAGKPEARIKVTCPTTLDPIFRVRDFGVSMTHEQIMRLYTTIFESTKEATNDQLGQFGLGSKTPFAYTDSFSVTAWLDGEKRSYVAYITDEDVPVINHVGTGPQGDEPQGIEISVPVRPANLHTFRTEIAHMVMSSDVMPELDGMEMPEKLFLHEGEGYRVVADNYGMGQLGVRQGCVVYPVTTFSSNYINYGFTLIIDVPIGTVDVTANREGLSLNDTTREAIRDRLSEVDRAIEAHIEQINASFPNRLAAFKGFAQHNGWLRASIGRRNVDLMPDKGRGSKRIPAQQLNCYYTKTKTRPQYQFTRTDNIRLLVDNGEPMLRRNLRMGAFYESHRHQMVAVVQRHELPRVVRVLGIAPQQVMTLQSIPDVQVQRASGHTLAAAGKHAAPRKLDPDMLWMPKTGVKTVQAHVGRAYLGTADDIDTHLWTGALKLLGVDRNKVVFLTEKQAETLQAPEDQRLDVVLKAKAAAYATTHKLAEKLADNADIQTVTNASNYWQMEQYIRDGFSISHFRDGLRNALYPTYLASVDGLRPCKDPHPVTDIEEHVVNISELPRSGALTKTAIRTKVVSDLAPLKAIIKSSDPMAALVKFYIDNN